MAALLIKESVNQTLDNMGFYNALNACFTIHELNHSHWAELHDGKEPIGLPEDGTVDWRSAPPVAPPARIGRRRAGLVGPVPSSLAPTPSSPRKGERR